MQEMLREEFTLTFDGEGVREHEVSAVALADSLLALHKLALRGNKLQFGKDADVFVKVKGPPREGSFDIHLLIDWATQNPELAQWVGGGVATGITGMIVGGVKLYKWCKGKPIQHTERIDDNTSAVINGFGDKVFFQIAL